MRVNERAVVLVMRWGGSVKRQFEGTARGAPGQYLWLVDVEGTGVRMVLVLGARTCALRNSGKTAWWKPRVQPSCVCVCMSIILKSARRPDESPVYYIG